jgi:hypothetical protein
MAPAATVIVPDDNFDLGKMPFHCGFEITETDRLEADIGIVKILDWWLDEKNFHYAVRAISDPTFIRKLSEGFIIYTVFLILAHPSRNRVKSAAIYGSKRK